MNNTNFFKQESSLPLYPREAYEKQENHETKQDQSEMANLLPLILQLSQGGDFDLSKILGVLGGNSKQSALIQALTTSLNNKQKKKEASVKTEAVNNKPFPKNEMLF